MAKNVEVQMEGLKLRLAKMRKRLSNPSPQMQKTSILMYKDVNDHFAKAKSDTGSWKPLKYRTGKPLQDTGALKSSVQAKNTRDSAVVSAGNSRVDYAAAQNYGTKTIPSRKFMWISKGIRENITKLLGKFFIGNML